MSRIDLDQIQAHLKAAIQNHQILVSRIQLQPQDMGLKSQLHNLQKEIMLMSQKQKLIVQKLRKELIERKPNVLQVEQIGKSAPVQSQSESTIETSRQTVSSPQPIIPPSQKSCDQPNKSPSSKSSTPPLRVPQYPNNQYPTNNKTSAVQILNNNNNNNNIKPKSEECLTVITRKSSSDKDLPVKDDTRHLESIHRDRELKRKLDYMSSLELITKSSLKDMQGKRSERKRRSTNNPNFAYGFELERRPRLSNFLGNEYFGAKRPKGRATKPGAPSPTNSRPTTPTTSDVLIKTYTSHNNSKENNVHDNLCRVCGLSGQLLLCDTCTSVYHLQCLSPALSTVPDTHWSCPKCQEGIHKSALSLAAVNSYIANKTGKEEDKRKLLRRSVELLQEKTHLENRTKQMNEILERQGIRKQDLIEINRKAQQSVENLKTFVKAVQSS